MSAIQDAAQRLAERLPFLVKASSGALCGSEARAATDTLAGALVAFGEACAGRVEPSTGPSRPFVPTRIQASDALLQSMVRGGFTEEQMIGHLLAELGFARGTLSELRLAQSAPIAVPAPPPTDIRLTADELDALLHYFDTGESHGGSEFEAAGRDALAKLRAARGTR